MRPSKNQLKGVIMNNRNGYNFNSMKTSFVALGCATALSFSSFSMAAKEISFGHVLSPDSHYGVGAIAFKEKLEEISGGEFSVNLYHNASLGGERDLVEGLQFGTVDVALVTTAPAGNFIPSFYVLDLPYIFNDYDEAHCVLDGEVGQELLRQVSEAGAGITGLAWAENGFRHITNSKRAITNPEDLEGLTIRTLENRFNMMALNAMGARATPIAWPELFTALQQGAVDGQENGFGTIIPSNLWEIQEHASKTGHLFAAAAVLASDSFYNNLSEEEKGWFRESALAARDANREKTNEYEEMAAAFFEEKGVSFVDSPDRDAFKSQVQPVYDEFSNEFGEEMLNKIESAKKHLNP